MVVDIFRLGVAFEDVGGVIYTREKLREPLAFRLKLA